MSRTVIWHSDGQKKRTDCKKGHAVTCNMLLNYLYTREDCNTCSQPVISCRMQWSTFLVNKLQ